MTMRFIDTHAHLDDPQFPDLPEVLEQTAAAGIERVINVGYGPDRWQTTLDLADSNSMVAPVLGIHPLDADQYNQKNFDRLRALVLEREPVAIGEAGIDLFRNAPELPIQRDAFAAQINLALEAGIPLVIHQRAAEDEVFEKLSASDPSLLVVLHSFDGTRKMIDLALERSWFIGVGGLMTKQTSQALRDLLKTVPVERMVLETDSPYLVPAGVKNRRNTPANIPAIATHLASITGRSLTEI
ncbi:MAG: TatD family hydrolase, partial [Thermomicrobiales bacterium]